MKRSSIVLGKEYVSMFTRSKKPKLFHSLKFINSKPILVTATQLKNYIMKDTLSDWLNLHYNLHYNHNKTRVYNNNSSFSKFIMNRGVEFEQAVINYINNKIPVVSVSEYITPNTLRKTIEYMKQGVPLIHSAPLINNYNNTGGIADILIRSDYLHKLVNDNPLDNKDINIPSFKLGLPFHYIVIDIKFTTLLLASNGKNILNSGRFPAYKAQLYIYNKALGHIQGYTPQYSFIMGRRWSIPSQNEKSYLFNDKLGVIDFKNYDVKYIEISRKAVQWVRRVKNHGHKWSISPPSIKELYPNMCIASDKWWKEKEEIAKNIGEISMLWNCGEKNRKIGFSNGIKSWRDPRCTSELIGITGMKSEIIDKMIWINNQDNYHITPNKITSSYRNWRNKSPIEFYIDFETICDIFYPFNKLPYQKPTNIIFMIGVGYVYNDKWNYTRFIAKDISIKSERKIMNDFLMFVAKTSDNNDYTMYYWYAEKNIWSQAIKRHDNYYTNLPDHLPNSIDLCDFFKSVPIIIKDCFGFGLKNIAKSMNEHGMINCKMESNCSSGMMASVNAWEAYNNLDKFSSIMNDIENYNTFDCKVLWNILDYLRKNH